MKTHTDTERMDWLSANMKVKGGDGLSTLREEVDKNLRANRTRPEQPCPPRLESITLTVSEIIDLAQFAGLELARLPDLDELETEYTITPCPESGLDDEGTARHYRYIAYDEERPEEGSNGLGPEIIE